MASARKTSPRRLRALGAPVIASLALFAGGCVGGIDDPQRFGDGTYCPPDVDVERMFTERCGGAICHGAGAEPAGGLDLESPGLAERMVGVPAEECSGWVRIDPDDPDASFLIAKLEGPPPGCGERMPFVGHLTPNEITCVRDWIVSVSGGEGGGGGAGGGSGDADGGAP